VQKFVCSGLHRNWVGCKWIKTSTRLLEWREGRKTSQFPASFNRSWEILVTGYVLPFVVFHHMSSNNLSGRFVLRTAIRSVYPGERLESRIWLTV